MINIWCVPDEPNYAFGDVIELFNTGKYDAVCVTTNGVIKKNGDLVMGKGVAKTISDEYTAVPRILANHVKRNGNTPCAIQIDGGYVISFPTKHNWSDDSDIDLIVDSMKGLVAIMDDLKLKNVLLPRPGVANGGLKWDVVYKAIAPYVDGRITFVSKNEQPTMKKPRILECSSAGDARFSAMYAEVMICKETQTIEEHYQLSKRFRYGGKIIVPKTIKEAKGRKPINFVIGDEYFDSTDLTSWYVYLWVKYLDENPELVKILEKYDDYSDKFKGGAINCQADVIRDYMNDRRALVKLHSEFFTRMRYLEQ